MLVTISLIKRLRKRNCARNETSSSYLCWSKLCEITAAAGQEATPQIHSKIWPSVQFGKTFYQPFFFSFFFIFYLANKAMSLFSSLSHGIMRHDFLFPPWKALFIDWKHTVFYRLFFCIIFLYTVLRTNYLLSQHTRHSSLKQEGKC